VIVFKCNCNREFESYDSLRKHNGRTHKIKSQDFYVKFYLNGEYPTCKCGCGEKTNWIGHGFREYRQGHIARIKNNWGHNQKAIDNSSKTRREQYKNGERKVWNDGLTIEDERVANNLINAHKWVRSKEGRKLRSENMKKNRLDGTVPTLYGKDSSQWQGGTSPLSARVYASNKLYKEWKYPILKRAGFKCKECGSSKDLHVHHNKEMMNEILKKFTGKNNPVKKVVDYHVRNKVGGVVLCYNHHKKQHPSLNF